MKIVIIDKNIYQFTFTKKKSEFAYNITAIIDGKTAIIIDLAYEIYSEKVKKYLIRKGISTFTIFISHHHEDHFDGCKSFEESTIYASVLFKDDYQQHLQTDSFLKSFEPSMYLLDGDSYKTENFVVKYIYTPGHNKCGFSFLVNNRYLYVGDLIFYNKNGLPSIPYIDDNSTISEHISSLIKIKNLNPKFLLLGHGKYLYNKIEINKQIDDRLFYLKKIQESNGEIEINECLIENPTKYSGLNFHKSNLDRF